MPIYRVTYGFSGNGVGSTETHMVNSQFNTARELAASLGVVRDTRAAMLAFPFQIVGIRVSAYSDGAPLPVRSGRNVWLDKTHSNKKPDTITWQAEPNSVQFQSIGTAPLNFTPPAFAGNKNYTYLGYPPDVNVTDNGVVVLAKNNLAANFVEWKQAMVGQQHGWGASIKFPTLKLITCTQNDDGTVSFITDPADLTKTPIGSIYPIRVKRLNNGRSPLNGAFNARLIDATHWVTEEQVAFVLAQTKGKLTPYWNVLQFVPYANLTLEPVVVKHKRGKPFGSEPGRAKARVRA